MKFKSLAIGACLILALASCRKDVDTTKNLLPDGNYRTSLIDPTSWTLGTLTATSTDPSQLLIANASLLPLNATLSGNKVFKCNNPEIFTGNGWLMQNARTDAT